MNSENNSANDCAAGQTNSGDSFSNSSAAIVNNSEISNSENIILLQTTTENSYLLAVLIFLKAATFRFHNNDVDVSSIGCRSHFLHIWF